MSSVVYKVVVERDSTVVKVQGTSVAVVGGHLYIYNTAPIGAMGGTVYYKKSTVFVAAPGEWFSVERLES
jgi:hypothetical protein